MPAEEKPKENNTWLWIVIGIVVVVLLVLIVWWWNDSSNSDSNLIIENTTDATPSTAKSKQLPQPARPSTRPAAQPAAKPAGKRHVVGQKQVSNDPKHLKVKKATYKITKMTVDTKSDGAKPDGTKQKANKMAPTATQIDSRNSVNVALPLTANQIIAAYNNASTIPNASGKKVAIVACYNYPNIQNDLNTFRKLYGLSPLTLNVHNMSPTTASDEGWAQEACLDTQYASLFGANVYAVFAASASLADLLAALEYVVTTVQPNVCSMSWGIAESSIASSGTQAAFEAIFAKGIANGTIFCASSGDSLTVNYPSSSPNVISVGGSTLNMIGNKRAGEYPWDDPNGDGSGKGISTLFAKPAYQTTNTSAYRLTPDLCLISNTPAETGVSVIFDGELYGIAGTSLSCPLFAGMIAAGLAQRTKPITQVALMTDMYNLVNQTAPFNEAADGIGFINGGFIPYLASL